MAICWGQCFPRDPGRGPESGLRRSTAASVRAKNGQGRCLSPPAAPRPTRRSTIASPRGTPLRPARRGSRVGPAVGPSHGRRAPVFLHKQFLRASARELGVSCLLAALSYCKGRPHQLRRSRVVGDPSVLEGTPRSHRSKARHHELSRRKRRGRGVLRSGFRCHTALHFPPAFDFIAHHFPRRRGRPRHPRSTEVYNTVVLVCSDKTYLVCTWQQPLEVWQCKVKRFAVAKFVAAKQMHVLMCFTHRITRLADGQ